MSVDREFPHLNNIRKDGEKTRNTVNKGKNKTLKTRNFVKSSILKLLIPTLLMSGIGISSQINKGSNSAFSNKNKKTEVINDENNILMDIESNGINDLATFKPNGVSYKPSLIENELHDSKLIFDDGKYDENNISGISVDEELGFAPGTHVAQTVKESLYLSMFRKLSDEDYQSMFRGLNNLRQGTLGDCYLVAAIKNLARSKYFNTLMMTSIERTGDDSFNLYMPLGEPHGVKVKITSEDLKAAGIRGAEGYKVLEVGFAKYLLFKEGVIPSPNMVITDKLIKKIEAGSAGEAMLSLLGPKSFTNIRLTGDPKNKLTVLNYLESFDPKDLGSISVSSKFKEGETDKRFYEVGGEAIYYGHAYNVCGIEKDGDIIKYVILDNPHNDPKKPGGTKIKLKTSDFLNCFSFIHISHLTDNFLNFTTYANEVKIVDSIDRKNS